MFCCPWSGLERLLAAGGGNLARLPLANRSVATLRLQAERTPEGVLGRLREEWARFPSEADRAARGAYTGRFFCCLDTGAWHTLLQNMSSGLRDGT